MSLHPPEALAAEAPGASLAPPIARGRRAVAGAYVAIAALGAVVWWLCRTYPAAMPAWAPWAFSWPEYLAATLSLFWYGRGLARTGRAARPPIWRRISFWAGLGATYAVLQTRIEYYAQHMFFLMRAQHMVMHHLGPFLMALGFPGPTLARGAPRRITAMATSRPVRAVLAVVQQPMIAATLFVGLVYVWLIPPVHFRAMIDPHLYALMNWSMVVDGLLFWMVVLDPRPKPPARAAYWVRAVMAGAVMFPQILLGALISFANRDLYPYYAFCGRLFPAIDAVTDQRIGGVIIWIPPAMMSAVALLLVLNFARLNEDRSAEPDPTMAAAARAWTGR